MVKFFECSQQVARAARKAVEFPDQFAVDLMISDRRHQGVEFEVAFDGLTLRQFAQTPRDRVRDGLASLAASAGIAIECTTKSHIGKEKVVARVLEQRGDHQGLVHIISAMEACYSYRPWHDKVSGKCLHYYFYRMNAALGLVYLRRLAIFHPLRRDVREASLR